MLPKLRLLVKAAADMASPLTCFLPILRRKKQIHYGNTKIPDIHDAQPWAASFLFMTAPFKNSKHLITFNSFVMQPKLRLLGMTFVILLFSSFSFSVKGQTTIFQFNFTSGNAPSIDNAVGTPSVSTIGTVSSIGTAGCAGNGLSGQNWDPGDGFRFTVNTTGYQSLSFSYDDQTSNLGIGTFKVRVSTDGTNWTDIRSSYTPSAGSCSGSGSLLLPNGFANQAEVLIEISKINDADNGSRSFRIDNATLIGTSLNVLTSNNLNAFGSICTNATASPNSFTLTGSNLDGTNVTVGPLTGYSFSTTVNGTYSNSLIISGYGTSINQQIFVKFSPTAVQSYNGNILISGGGASSINVAASGSGVNTAPTVSAGAATSITTGTATVPGIISATGCTAITAYGVEYSTSSGFANGSGTQVPGSNLSGTSFSVALSGLTQNTTYYYHTYATNGGGTSYSVQGSFTTSTSATTTTTIDAVNATYGDASVDLVAHVSPATATGTVEFYVNGSLTPTGTVTLSSGVATYTYSLTGVNTGLYSLRAKYLGATGYSGSETNPETAGSLLVGQKALTATSTVASKVYNGSPAAGAVTVGTVTGYVGTETLVITASASDYSNANVGTGKATTITYSLADGTNGGLAANYSMADLVTSGVITPKALSITTATVADKTYDALTASGTVTSGTLSGFVAGETVTATASGVYADANAQVGKAATISYVLHNGTGGGLASNYSVAPTPALGNINPKALTATSTIASKVYDGSAVTGTVTLGSVTGLVGSETLVITPSAANYADANVGTGKATTITYSLADGSNGGKASNYSMANLAGSGNITARPITVTPNPNQFKIYSCLLDPVLAYQVTSGTVVNGDAFSGGLSRAPGDDVGLYEINGGNLSLGTNYTLTVQSGVKFEIKPQNAMPFDATTYYTGPELAWTTGPTSNTASVMLSATIKNSLLCGDIRTAKITFGIRGANNSYTPIAGAANLPVSLVDPNNPELGGVARATVNFTIPGNDPSAFYEIAVIVSGNYVANDPLRDGHLNISRQIPGGIITGVLNLCNDNSAGYVKGTTIDQDQQPIRSTMFFTVTYNKSLKNPQGSVALTIYSNNKPDGTPDIIKDANGNPAKYPDGSIKYRIHTYRVKSNSITALNVTNPTASFTSKANISEDINGNLVSIEGNCTMIFDMNDVATGNNTSDQVAITIYRKSGGIWYSNNWDLSKNMTTMANICGGDLSVTGVSSATSNTIVSAQNVRNVPVIREVKPVVITKFSLKAYPNPSTSQFTVQMESSDRYEKVQLRVMDLNGRVIEVMNNLSANQTIQVGASYRPGMYIVEMIQGENKKQLKLIKQPD